MYLQSQGGFMTVEEYIAKNGCMKTWFAEQCEISLATLYNILNGKKVGKFIALRVEAMTKGQVPAKSIMKNGENGKV
jgi:hypothetical protein